MKRSIQTTIRAMMTLLIIAAGAAVAQNPTIDWFTIDGGGEMSSIGGTLELSGTIGQPDPNEMVLSGGSLELVGGFWAGAAAVPTPCVCLGNFNGDTVRNGEDIQSFVDCLTATGTNCDCADLDANAILDMSDVTAFVNDLLTSPDCP